VPAIATDATAALLAEKRNFVSPVTAAAAQRIYIGVKFSNRRRPP
jgi:hypothetical protein